MDQKDHALITEHQVQPDWIDFNDHMNGAYFMIPFDRASVHCLQHVGVDENYRLKTCHSTFALESHIVYLNELKKDQHFLIHSYIYDFDAKRIHLFHQMRAIDNNRLLATLEVVTLHVNLTTKKSAPFANSILKKIEDLNKRQQSNVPLEFIKRQVGLNQAKQ